MTRLPAPAQARPAGRLVVPHPAPGPAQTTASSPWSFQLPGQHVISAHLVLDIPLQRGGPRARGRGHDLRPGARRGHPPARRRRVRRAAGDRGRGLRDRAVAWPGCRRSSTCRPPISSRRWSCSPRRSASRPLSRPGRRPARPAAAGRDRAGPGQLGAGRQHRLPVGGLRRGEPRLPDERRRARDGRPGHRRGRCARSTHDHFGPARATLIMAGDFQQRPAGAGRALLRQLAEPEPAGGGHPGAGRRRRVG